MGCVFYVRKNQVIHPYCEMTVNKITGLIIKKLKGILFKGKEIITRFHEWRLELCSGTDALAAA
jgi:hypothetical protein